MFFECLWISLPQIMIFEIIISLFDCWHSMVFVYRSICAYIFSVIIFQNRFLNIVQDEQVYRRNVEQSFRKHACLVLINVNSKCLRWSIMISFADILHSINPIGHFVGYNIVNIICFVNSSAFQKVYHDFRFLKEILKLSLIHI